MVDTLKIHYRSPKNGFNDDHALQLLTRLYKGNEKKAKQIINNPGCVIKTSTDRDGADKFITRMSELGITCYIDQPEQLDSDTNVEDEQTDFDFVSSITCPHCGAQQEMTKTCLECGQSVNTPKKSPGRKDNSSEKNPYHLSDRIQAEPGLLYSSRLPRKIFYILLFVTLVALGIYLDEEPEVEADKSVLQTATEKKKYTSNTAQKDIPSPSKTDSGTPFLNSPENGQAPEAAISLNAPGTSGLNLAPPMPGTVPEAINLPPINSSSNNLEYVPNTPGSLTAKILENQFGSSNNNTSIMATVNEKGDHMNSAQPVFSAPKVDIPPHLMSQIQELDPLTDSGWEKKVAIILKELGPDERKFVYSQHLEPKGIHYDSSKRRFSFNPDDSLKDAIRETQNAELSNIGNKLIKLIEAMQVSKTARRFADQIEGAVDLINSFDAGGELPIQKEKNRMRKALLSELVSVTRKAQFEVERNPRALSVAAIQNFIIEVYIKHQLLGYRFRTLPVGTLEQDPRPFVRDVIAKEARLRQCDIIKTDSLMYLIAPVKNAHQNPYSIRRFLIEESLLDGRFIYFNGVIINQNKRLQEERYQKGVTRILERIVTLERQLSDNIVNLIREFDEFHEQTLKPLVTSSLAADGSSIGLSIDSRMEDFELHLEKEILARVDHAIVNIASTNDDYEFLFFSLRRILIELATEVRDFTRDAAAGSQRAEITELKIIALLHLLDKRKAEIFTNLRSEEIDSQNEPTLLLKELHFSLKKYGKEISKLNIALREALDKEESMNKTGFKAWLQRTLSFNRKSNQALPDEIRKNIYNARRKCFLGLIRTLKQYPKIRIYMEFEEVTPIIDGIRHYAIAQGNMGISELPMMLRLQEDANAFDIGTITKVLTPRFKPQ